MRWRHSLLVVLVSVTELSWLYPWLALLDRFVTRQGGILNPILVFALFFLALGVAGSLNRWRIADRYQRIVVGGFILLTALLMIRVQVYPSQGLWNLRWIGSSLTHLLRFDPGMSQELFLVLATFTIWWRGLVMSQRLLLTDTVGFLFRLGILLLIGLLIVQAVSYRQDMTGWVLSLFLCGLVSVALARSREGVPSRQAAEQFNLRWFFSLLVGAAGTLLIGLLVSAILSAENLATVWRWLLPVRIVLAVIVFSAVWVVSYVLIMLINAAFQYFSPGVRVQDISKVTQRGSCGIRENDVSADARTVVLGTSMFMLLRVFVRISTVTL